MKLREGRSIYLCARSLNWTFLLHNDLQVNGVQTATERTYRQRKYPKGLDRLSSMGFSSESESPHRWTWVGIRANNAYELIIQQWIARWNNPSSWISPRGFETPVGSPVSVRTSNNSDTSAIKYRLWTRLRKGEVHLSGNLPKSFSSSLCDSDSTGTSDTCVQSIHKNRRLWKCEVGATGE